MLQNAFLRRSEFVTRISLVGKGSLVLYNPTTSRSGHALPTLLEVFSMESNSHVKSLNMSKFEFCIDIHPIVGKHHCLVLLNSSRQIRKLLQLEDHARLHFSVASRKFPSITSINNFHHPSSIPSTIIRGTAIAIR